jgi:Xaa-Pro dipeptidase
MPRDAHPFAEVPRGGGLVKRLALFLLLLPSLALAEIPIRRDPGLKARARKERIARALLPAMRNAGLKAWLVLTREGTVEPLAFDVGLENAVARAAGLFVDEGGASPRAVALVASYDVDGPKSSGIYGSVEPYGKEGLGPSLKAALARLVPSGRIGLDISADTPIADGLTAGTRDWLAKLVSPATAARFTSAEEAVVSFRAKKTPEEIEHLRAAALATDALLREALSPRAIVPGKTTEKELAAFIRKRMAELAVGYSWEESQNPNVIATVSRGHSASGDAVLAPGTYVRIDFGIDVDGYKTDIQRSAYLLRAGVRGVDVDTAGRRHITDAGYPEFVHGTGHPIGFYAHDIGPYLCPDWPERYGKKVFLTLGENETYAVEPSVPADVPWMGKGKVDFATEEDLVVTAKGPEYLAPPQKELILIPVP